MQSPVRPGPIPRLAHSDSLFVNDLISLFCALVSPYQVGPKHCREPCGGPWMTQTPRKPPPHLCPGEPINKSCPRYGKQLSNKKKQPMRCPRAGMDHRAAELRERSQAQETKSA